MAHPPPYPKQGDDTVARPDRDPTPGPPRWMAVIGIAVAVGLVILLVALHLTGAMGSGVH